MTSPALAPTISHDTLLQELFAAGLLIESGVQGVYGHGATFELIRDRLTSVVSELAAADGATRLSFPPIVPRSQLETNGYLGNFPHLSGCIFGFEGSEADAVVLAERASAHEDWSEFESQTDLMMLPAACYPLYPALAERGPVPEGGLVVDIGGAWVFRHEPSTDPARRQIFRMHEVVRIGAAEAVSQWRLDWAQRSLELFAELGLEAQRETANDPFFGRRGRLMAASQNADELKWEVLVQISGDEPTACASSNYHQDHFGQVWGLKLEDGSLAHTACTAFGQDRMVLALLRIHGLDPGSWPASVRERLGLTA